MAARDDAPRPAYLGHSAAAYSTTLGTFMSADTLTTDGLNRYAYVRGNPLRYSDPSGHGVTGGGGLDEGYCPATKPACIHDGSGPVGGTGKPAPVSGRCDALCQGLRALYHAGLTSPELVEQARGGAAPAPNVRTSENGGGGGCGWNPRCRLSAALDTTRNAVDQADRIQISVLSELPYGLYYGSYQTLSIADSTGVPLPIEMRAALWAEEGFGLGANEALDYYRAWRWGRDRHEGRVGPIWGNEIDARLRSWSRRFGVELPNVDVYLPGIHRNGQVDWEW